MADGKIIIETDIDTSGIKKDLNSIEKASKTSSSAIKNDFDSIEKSAKSQRSQVMSLASQYRKAGMESSDAMKKAWSEIERTSSNGARKLKDDLDGIGKSGGTTGNSLFNMGNRASSGLALAAGAAAAAGVAIIAIGKSAIEAAGSAKAIQAQFTQVFGDLEPAAQQAVEKMADKFGMVPNRLKPSMSQMTSMFKGLGLDTESAMAKATDAVTASADAAAFYDVSYSDANSALTSFIKGNYEGGEAIGLFANDTQMAQYAIQKGLVGTTAEWSSLDEATKQATRLEYAQNMQKLAGATGQATRESDGLENQLGNLNQAWTDFMAIVGGPILGLAVDALKGLTSGLQSAGEGFKVITENASKMDFSGLSAELKPFSKEFERLKMVAVGAFDEAKTKVMEVMPQIIEAVQPILGAFQSLWGNIKPVFLYLVQTLYEDVIPALSAMFAAFMESLPAIISFLTPIYEVLTSVISFVGNVIGMIVALLQGDWSTAWQFAGSAVQNVVDAIGSILNFLCSVITGIFTAIATAITTSWQGIYDNGVIVWNSISSFLSGVIQSIYDNTIGKLVETAVGIAEKWDEIKATAGLKWEEIKTNIITTISGLPDAIKGIAIDMINKMVQGIQETAGNVYGAVTGLVNDIITKFKQGLGIASPAKELIEIGKYMIQGLINGLNGDALMSFVNNMVEELKAKFSSGSFNLQAAIDFVGTGAAEFFKSIGIGGASFSGLTAPVSGGVTSNFGNRDAFMTDSGEMSSSYHAGIDIGAAYGEAVGAAGAGTVTQAGWNGGYGNSVTIDHGNGLETFYAHLSEILVSVGQLVTQLQTIGLVGSTGNSTGAHLHFGVYQDGVAIDPSSLFGLATGTNRVPQTAPYLLHKDEAVIPKKYNPYLNGDPAFFAGIAEKMQAAVAEESYKWTTNNSAKANLKAAVENVSGTKTEPTDLSKLDGILDVLSGIANRSGNVLIDGDKLVGIIDGRLGTISGIKGRGGVI